MKAQQQPTNNIQLEDLSGASQEKLQEVGRSITVADYISEVFYENDFSLTDILAFCKKYFKVSKKWIQTYTSYKFISK